eukprot:767406-Hanusia_phi.AAC.4
MVRQAVRNYAFIESLASKPPPSRSLPPQRSAADRESGIARWPGFGEQRQAGEGSILLKSLEWNFGGGGGGGERYEPVR